MSTISKKTSLTDYGAEEDFGPNKRAKLSIPPLVEEPSVDYSRRIIDGRQNIGRPGLRS
jgi:hypothetical protein